VVGTETVGSHTFLTFDTPESGFQAMDRLLQGPGYRDLSFEQGMRRWTTGTTSPTVDPQSGRPVGYDLPAMTRGLGIDPSQPIASLSPAQRAALVQEMARREGYPVARANVQYAAAAPPPEGAVAYPSAAFVDTGGAAPAVGYPPPAPTPTDYRGLPFRRTAPDLSPAALGLKPAPALFPGPTGAIPAPGPLVEPKLNVPLTTIKKTDKSGQEQTYSVPSVPSPAQAANMKLAGFDDFRTATAAQVEDWKQREDADAAERKQMDADIARARGATPAEITNNQIMYHGYREALDNLLSDFPSPEERAKYIGWTNQTLREIYGHMHEDPRFNLFMNRLDPFQYRNLKDVTDEVEQRRLANLLPTGRESSASSFEERLQQFNDHVNLQQGIYDNISLIPPNARPAWWNAVGQYGRDQLAADKQAAADQLAAENQGVGRVGGGAVGAALSAPPASAPPEAPPATIVIGPPPRAAAAQATPPPFTVLGHWQE
jgi:hypothetical protein